MADHWPDNQRCGFGGGSTRFLRIHLYDLRNVSNAHNGSGRWTRAPLRDGRKEVLVAYLSIQSLGHGEDFELTDESGETMTKVVTMTFHINYIFITFTFITLHLSKYCSASGRTVLVGCIPSYLYDARRHISTCTPYVPRTSTTYEYEQRSTVSIHIIHELVYDDSHL